MVHAKQTVAGNRAGGPDHRSTTAPRGARRAHGCGVTGRCATAATATALVFCVHIHIHTHTHQLKPTPRSCFLMLALIFQYENDVRILCVYFNRAYRA